ncbi:hypothetical protein [Chryseobacterium luteum]|uniref:MORN repeat variant n=1 Tax=Chryseobacterium luteum TaxID=421531 RepID=A0A085ZBC6_9FLAO|nr:hypothetical protein [Chryseobacterium luteum]KFF01740.1 hypothetical protein IX38_16885 [Chryseobacterium luteum]
MKIFISLIFSLCFFLNSCAQQKYEKPPGFGKGKIYKIQKGIPYKKEFNYLNVNQLDKLSNGLFCWKSDNDCQILDGKTKLFNYYQTSGDDNPTLVPYTYAEGEFLKGKYQGIWKYFDKKSRLIKKEKWANGQLIYRKEYNFNTCDNWEQYKFSNINSSEYNSIEQFKKDFSIKSGNLVCENGIVKSMQLIFEDETTIQFISINNGLTKGHEIQIKGDPVPSGKSYFYDKKGNVKRISEVENELLEGNGHYIDYYYPENKKNSGVVTIPIKKAEGEVRNNLKFGEWKYYNKEGKMDSIKTYALKDSIDVRFPYCIFNKNEPCY